VSFCCSAVNPDPHPRSSASIPVPTRPTPSVPPRLRALRDTRPSAPKARPEKPGKPERKITADKAWPTQVLTGTRPPWSACITVPARAPAVFAPFYEGSVFYMGNRREQAQGLAKRDYAGLGANWRD
jgi:hypothetical protein